MREKTSQLVVLDPVSGGYLEDLGEVNLLSEQNRHSRKRANAQLLEMQDQYFGVFTYQVDLQDSPFNIVDQPIDLLYFWVCSKLIFLNDGVKILYHYELLQMLVYLINFNVFMAFEHIFL